MTATEIPAFKIHGGTKYRAIWEATFYISYISRANIGSSLILNPLSLICIITIILCSQLPVV